MAADAPTQHHIVTKAKEYIEIRPDEFRKFYCEKVLAGKYTSTGQSCELFTLLTTEEREASEEKYKETFAQDLGDFWTSNIISIINSIQRSTPSIVPTNAAFTTACRVADSLILLAALIACICAHHCLVI